MAAVVVCLGLVLGAGRSARAQAPDHPAQYSAEEIAVGQRVYGSLCVACHGPTGAGVSGVDLRRGPLRRASTDAALRALVTSGIPASGMPSFRLEPAELTGIVAFIRAGFENSSNIAVPVGDASRGQAIFEGKGNCLSCHRVDDRGSWAAPELTDIGRQRAAVALSRTLLDPTGSMLPINRPVRAVTRDGSTIQGRRLNEDLYTVQLITDQGRLVSLVKSELRSWSVSTTSTMPSYKDTLTQAELADLIGYLLSLKGTRP